MLRRNPTRIKVKLDDLEEFNQMKNDKELDKPNKNWDLMIVTRLCRTR
jgi:hypothetical protein